MFGQTFLFVFPGIDEEERKMMTEALHSGFDAGIFEDEFEVRT